MGGGGEWVISWVGLVEKGHNLCRYVLVGKGLNFGVKKYVIRDFINGNGLFN